MAKYFLIVLFLGLSNGCYSQEAVLLKGQIVADSLNGAFINIVNITQETGSVNNEHGEFEIQAQKNDTLYFSSVQYEVMEVIITEEIVDAAYLEVTLALKINELEEVKISNITLSGNLENDLSSIKTFSQADVGIPYPTRPRLSVIDRKIYAASSGALSLLISTLNGDLKKLKKARANQQLDRLVHRGMEAVPLTVFVEDFRIPEEHVLNFVYFCAEDPNFKEILNLENPLELIDYYQSRSEYYLKERMGK